MFIFLSVVSEKLKNTISESLKFIGSIYRILKSQESIFFTKVSLEKQFSLIDLSCCDK